MALNRTNAKRSAKTYIFRKIWGKMSQNPWTCQKNWVLQAFLLNKSSKFTKATRKARVRSPLSAKFCLTSIIKSLLFCGFLTMYTLWCKESPYEVVAKLYPSQCSFKHITISMHTIKMMKTQVFREIWNFCIKRYSDTKFHIKFLVISNFDGCP